MAICNHSIRELVKAFLVKIDVSEGRDSFNFDNLKTWSSQRPSLSNQFSQILTTKPIFHLIGLIVVVTVQLSSAGTFTSVEADRRDQLVVIDTRTTVRVKRRSRVRIQASPYFRPGASVT